MIKILRCGDKIYNYNKSIIVKFVGRRAVLSTGVTNGGYSENLTAIFNNDAKTSPGMGCILKAPTYKEHMEIISRELGLDPKYTSGLGTAADMENMSIVEEKYEELSVTALVTGGIEKNGGRVGDPASYVERNGKTEVVKNGTINIIVSIDGNLPPRTLTRALITITEAKTAAIQELLEGSKYSSGIATGSGTDGVIVYSNLESENIYNDAGKHSKLGELLGKVVKKAVKDADLEEERRLFYVAVTRAKTYLFLYSLKELYQKDAQISRYIGELRYDKKEFKKGRRVVHKNIGKGTILELKDDKIKIRFDNSKKPRLFSIKYLMEQGLLELE